jgi:hypothetical protein
MPARKFCLYRLIVREIDNMKQYVIMVDLQTDTVEYVKNKLESKSGTPLEAQRLSFRGKVLGDGELKRKHGVGNLRDFEYILQAWDARKITLTIASHFLPEAALIPACPSLLVGVFKARPGGLLSISQDSFYLTYDTHTHTLTDDHTLNAYNIHYDATLKLPVRLHAGATSSSTMPDRFPACPEKGKAECCLRGAHCLTLFLACP